MRPVIEFDKAWTRLAEQGIVNMRGGAEYRRIFERWMGQHQPDEIEDFIKSNLVEVKA